MTFAAVPPDQENNERDAWAAGPYRLVALGYLLGQTRVQLWYWPERNRWPDVLDPQFCTYQDGMACMAVAAITRVLADVDEDTPPQIASNHLRVIAEIFGGCMFFNAEGSGPKAESSARSTPTWESSEPSKHNERVLAPTPAARPDPSR